MSEVIKGTVKWFNDAKGFGFIEHEKGDVFVHFSAIESAGFKTLKNGEEVQYELEDGDKGLHAKKVIRLNPPKDLASQIEIERTAPSPQTSESINDAEQSDQTLETVSSAKASAAPGAASAKSKSS
jgi:CspA family cold shock protein